MSELVKSDDRQPIGTSTPQTPAENLSPERLSQHQPPVEAVKRKLDTIDQIKLDELRQGLEGLPQISCPVIDRFTPGLYTREIFMPKDTFIISKIHKTEHPFVVTKGKCAVWIEGEGVVVIEAPYVGITQAGTRRALYVIEDCSWITFHPTTKTTVDEVEQEIILKPNVVVDVSEIGNDILKQLINCK